MKNIIITLALILSVSCKAQILSLETKVKDIPVGAYVKDLNNEMDKYVGTWQWTNGNDVLTIVLQKKNNIYDGEYYEDLLVGEYSYASNGVEIVNTLSSFNDFTIIGRKHNISGNFLLNRLVWVKCLECGQNEKRFALNFYDPEFPYLTSIKIVLRHLPLELTENGTTSSTKMTATIFATHGVSIPDENSPTVPRVPYGEYLMVKQ